MKDTLETISKIPTIQSVKKIVLTKELEKRIPKMVIGLIKKGYKKVNAYSVQYKSNGHNVAGYIVESKKVTKNSPCIIWNRGGSKHFGGITMKGVFVDMARLAEQGYIVFASQYSGGPGSEGEDDFGGEVTLNDVLNLKKIINKYPSADSKNVVMMGWSRGGMMTYRALAEVKWIKAAIVGAGPTDEVTASAFREGWREHQVMMYGGSKKEQIKRSAVYWTDKISKKTPILIMHGTSDWRVSVKSSTRLSEKLIDEKVPHRLVIFEGGDHGLSEHRKDVDEMTAKWLERFIKNKEKLPDLKPHGR